MLVATVTAPGRPAWATIRRLGCDVIGAPFLGPEPPLMMVLLLMLPVPVKLPRP